MEFKKATRNTNFDDFINGAKETEIAKTNKEQETEQEKIILKLPKDLCEEIDKRIIKWANKIATQMGMGVFEMDKNSKASLEIHNLCEEIDKKLN